MSVPFAYVINGSASSNHKKICFKRDLEIVSMIHGKIGKDVNGNVLSGIKVLNYAEDEEDQRVSVVFYYLLESEIVTIKVLAVATCAVVHLTVTFQV